MTGALFLGLQPDEQTRSLLAQLLAPFGSSGRLPGRLSSPDNWHITVRFLGPLDEPTVDRLLATVDQMPRPGSFKVKLGGFGAFPNADKATVLWVGVESEALHELAARLEQVVTSLGLEPDERPFRPHLTLSRIRPPLDLNDLLDDDWGRLSFVADELILFAGHSEGGTTYEPVERFPL